MQSPNVKNIEENMPPKNQAATATAAPTVEVITPVSIAVNPLSSFMKFANISFLLFYLPLPINNLFMRV
jgi:hypothetical protein